MYRTQNRSEIVSQYAHTISGIIAFIALILMVGIAGTTDTGIKFASCAREFITVFAVFCVSGYIAVRTN